jgi:hypothetical protein
MKIFILYFALVSVYTYAAKTSSLLLSAFCPSVGTQTSQALIQSQKLDDIITQLKEDPNCSSVAASTQNLLSNITSLDSMISSQDEGSQISRKLSLYEEQQAFERAGLIASFREDSRTSYIRTNPNANETDINEYVDFQAENYIPESELLSLFNTKVNELKVEKLSNQLQVGFDEENNTDVTNKVNSIKANMGSIFTALNTSSACTNANESIAPSIISNVLGLASSFIPGVAGIAVGLGSELINSSAELIRNMKYNGLRRDVERNEMKEALSCSFEGIMNTYCKAKDTLNLIHFESIKKSPDCDTENCKLLNSGIDLISKKSSSLNSWINLILSGAAPRDESQVGPYSSAISLRATFNVLKQTLDGMLNGARYQLSLPGSNKNLVIRNLMESLATTIANNASGGGSSSPYADFFQVENDKECGAWAYIYNPADNNDRRLEGRDTQVSCAEYATALYETPVPVSTLQERIRVLNEETSGTVAFAIQLVSEENTSSILSRYDSLNNIFKSSPQDFMDNTLKYYSDFRAYLAANNINRILLNNLILRAENQIFKAKKVISFTKCSDFDDPTTTDPTTTDPTNDDQNLMTLFQFTNLAGESCDVEATKLANLSLILAPNQQVLSVENSLRAVFREHVEIAKLNGDISNENLILILNSNSEDSSSILVRNSLGKQQLFEDSTTAMSISKDNLKNFWKTFSKAIIATAKNLKSSKDEYVLGRLCVRAALSPLTSKRIKKLKRYCTGSVYKSTNREVQDIRFDDIISVEFKDKACTVYNFQRKIEYLNNL